MNKTPTIVCFGEVLWDVFPDQKRLGGAPLNVALRLHSLGAAVSMVSAVGKDDLGQQTLSVLEDVGLPTNYLQKNQFPTGQVQVTLDAQGSASYVIEENAAWDHIEHVNPLKELVKKCDALVFGSLACRQTNNLHTLEKLIDESEYAIFDLNLRAPHYGLATIFSLMRRADVVKMNDEELSLIVNTLDIPAESLEGQLLSIGKKMGIATLCVTLGAEGALLVHLGTCYRHSGYPTQVVDTVGAGDSFLAGLIFGLLSYQDPNRALDLGCALGSLVAGKAGANAKVEVEEIHRTLKLN